MRQTLKALALTPLALVMAMPASAALIVCADQTCAGSVSNVLFNNNDTGSTIFGSIGSTQVTFNGSTTMQTQGSGQASLQGSGGGPLTGTVTFFVAGSTFTDFVFNLPGIAGNPPPAEANSVTFNMLNGQGVSYTSSSPYPTYGLDDNGENFFSGHTTGGDVIQSITLTLNPVNAGVNALEQVRLGGFADIPSPVPEPSTWAMLVCGFGVVGISMRRRQKTSLTFA